uniref:Protein RFT1 homolog n=1 Tax=Rhabditophanes sp. KR3021 TaxID=114890 RepID=A0AC35UCA6_9BILA
MSTFGSILVFNLLSQFLSRIFSFLTNIYFIKTVDPELLGLINVRLTLLYATITFLCREPFRKTLLSVNKPVKELINLMWLSLPLSIVLGSALSIVWFKVLSPPPLQFQSNYGAMIICFAFSAIIKSLVEPIAITAFKFGDNQQFSIALGLLVFAQKVGAFVLIVTGLCEPLTAFCLAQILGSVFYLLSYVTFWLNNHNAFDDKLEVCDILPNFQLSLGSRDDLLNICSMFGNSIVKQSITNSTGYIMTFTNTLSLTDQAIYNIIESLGSLVIRIILTPVEESAFIFFSTKVIRGGKYQDYKCHVINEITTTFTALTKATITIAFISAIFAPAYSTIIVHLYGGNLLSQNNGALLLTCYAVYLSVTALNGITECLSMASMNKNEIFKHSQYLIGVAIVQVIMSIILSQQFGSSGFIVSNIINMSLRVIYSLKHIKHLFKESIPSIFHFIPSLVSGVALIVAFIVTEGSFLTLTKESAISLESNLLHIVTGGLLFILVSALILHKDFPELNITSKIAQAIKRKWD